MGKHSSGRTRAGLAGWLWVVLTLLVILAALIALVVVFSRADNGESTSAEPSQQQCDHTITLNIVADPASQESIESLVSDYAATNPVVHENCVNPQITYANTAQATNFLNSATNHLPALWVAAGEKPADSLSGSGAQPDSTTLIHRDQLGIINPPGTSGSAIDHSGTASTAGHADTADAANTADSADNQVIYPIDSTWSAYAAAASYLEAHPDAQPDDNTATDAAKMITEAKFAQAVSQLGEGASARPVAAPQALGPDGSSFSPLDDAATIDINLVSMSSSAQVGEDQARAGADFVKFVQGQDSTKKAADTPQKELASPVVDLALKQSAKASEKLPPLSLPDTSTESSSDSATSTESSAPTTTPQAAPPADDRERPASTLLLLDSSDAMSDGFDEMKALIADQFRAAGERGAVTSLWNFSSPSGSLGMAHRDNVDLSIGDRGTRCASQVTAIDAGGGAYLYDSLVAAVLNASLSGPAPKRVIVVTASTNAGSELDASNARLQIELITARVPVAIDVIALGDHVDPLLEPLTQETGGRYYPVASGRDATFGQVLITAFGNQ